MTKTIFDTFKREIVVLKRGFFIFSLSLSLFIDIFILNEIKLD